MPKHPGHVGRHQGKQRRLMHQRCLHLCFAPGLIGSAWAAFEVFEGVLALESALSVRFAGCELWVSCIKTIIFSTCSYFVR